MIDLTKPNWAKCKYIVNNVYIYIADTKCQLESKMRSSNKRGYCTEHNAPKELLEELKHRNEDGTRNNKI